MPSGSWSTVIGVVLAIASCALLTLVPALESWFLAVGSPVADMAPDPASTAAIVLGYKMHADGALWPPLRLRVDAAAELLAAGTANTILFTGGVPPERPHLPSEARSMEQHMRRCHSRALSASTDVLLEERSGSTRGNAERALAVLRRDAPHVRVVIVVTNGFHQLRAKKVFQRVAGDQYTVHALATPSTLESMEKDIARCPSDVTHVWGGTASASSVRSWHLEHRPGSAFDESAASYWHSAQGMPQWLQYSVENSKRVCGYILRSRPDKCCAAADSPTDWDVIGEPDTADPSIVQSVRGAPTWSHGEQRIFLLSAPLPVQRVRWVIHEVPGRDDGRQFAVLSSVSLLVDCTNVSDDNGSVDPGLAADAPVPSSLWVKLVSTVRELGPWTWRMELTWEILREFLAIGLYAKRGWL